MPERNNKPIILLAEDEPVVRNVVQLALSRAGYHVLACADGDEAMTLSRSFSGDIDLVLTDVKMPHMIGPELVRRIRLERPTIRVLMMTGQATIEIPAVLRPETLHKPFLPSELLERVAQALNGASSESHPLDSLK